MSPCPLAGLLILTTLTFLSGWQGGTIMKGCARGSWAVILVVLLSCIASTTISRFNSRNDPPTPTPATSPVAISEAQRIRVADGLLRSESEYTTMLVDTTRKCGLPSQGPLSPYTIPDTADLIMTVGDEIEKIAPAIEVPRYKLMYQIVFDKDNDVDCAIYLGAAFELIKIEAEKGTFDTP